MEHQKSYSWFPNLSDVNIAMSLSRSTRDFLKLLFHMFPYSEILKVLKVFNISFSGPLLEENPVGVRVQSHIE